MKIRWSQKAFQNLYRETEFLDEHSHQAARHFVSKILQALEHLKNNPYMGRQGRVSGTREYILNDFPYIIPYRILNEEIQIIRIFHTSRKWPKRF